jgi:D-serine deaminase-like pyridoxal phosphate-dependent protein
MIAHYVEARVVIDCGSMCLCSRRSPDYIDGAQLVYAACGVGVVHDLSRNEQRFFSGHTDDITCVTLSNDGAFAATGQMG